VIKAGLIAVPSMPLLRARELHPILEKAHVTAALCDIRLRDELLQAQVGSPLQQVLYFNDGDGRTPAGGSLEAICAKRPADFPACDTAQDDIALIAFTSGTTGQPKGTMHMHRDILAMCDLFPRSILKPRADDIFCGTPPLAFTFGLGGLLCFPMRVAASVLLVEKATPESLLVAIARHRATILFTAPTFYRQMAPLLKNHDVSSLRKCVSAGEALPDATRQLWRGATGIEMIDGIGATEMIHIFISAAADDVRRGAIGKVVPGYEARIVDENMNTLPPGTVGKLAVRGPTGCRYLADERQRDYVRDGWNLTGDTFLMDQDGYLFYQARSDDMIISAGYNIAGPEVEDALLSHPAVAECGVVGAPDEARGQAVKAIVVLRPGLRPGPALIRELQDHVKKAIAPYKYPRLIEFVESLPRTETGKLQRFRLREIPAGSVGAAAGKA
nr:AMP-binding protein [Lautropia sp.]